MDALIVIDMQEGLLLGDPKHELAAVVTGVTNALVNLTLA